jgi:hypothetical protein
MNLREREMDEAREAAALRAALRQASRDAPRRDLWPRLEGEVAALGHPRRARAWWARPLRRLALASLSLALILAVLLGALAYGRPRAPQVATGTAPELLLALRYQGASPLGGYTIAARRPAEAAGVPLLDHATGPPTIAPDGRQLLFVEQQLVGQTVRTALVAYAADTLARQWSAPLGEQALSGLDERALTSRVVVAGDRVYAVSFRLGLDDPLVVRALARNDGVPVASWPVATDGRAINEVNLLATPDEQSLHLFVRLAETAGSAEVQDRHVALALPGGGQQARTLAGDLVATTTLYGAGGRIAPDGRTFYRLTFEGRLAFFDLARDTRPTLLALPFARTASGGLIPLAQGVAADGTRLYALAPTLGQLAIVDLAGRRVERVVQLGGAPGAREAGPVAGVWSVLRDSLAPEAGATGNFTATLQVSPDGQRLYAVGASGRDSAARLGGVWVIETASWRIAEHWQAAEAIEALLLVDRGQGLLVQSSGRLRLLDTTSGQFTSELAEPPGLTTITSLGELYREQYGRALRPER